MIGISASIASSTGLRPATHSAPEPGRPVFDGRNPRPEPAPREPRPELIEELGLALEELRELARGLHPGAVAEHGLLHALEALQRRVTLPIELDVAPERLPEDLEATVYYIVAEALTNVTRHAGATRVRVTVAREDGVVRVEIADDGKGGAETTGGTGLIGLRDRAEAAGGTLAVVSPPGGGTVVTASLPLAEA